MKHKDIEALAELLFALSTSRLSCDQPELQKDLKMAAGLILLLANCLTWRSMYSLPTILEDTCGFAKAARES
jgi:hypothetical protein